MRAAKSATLSLFAVLAVALLLRGDLPQVATGNWTPLNSLAEARSGSAAAVLQDGRIMFTGGTGATGPLSSAELFHANGSFALTAPMQDPRTRHTATTLDGGRVLVTGGTTSGGGTTNSAEVYDPATPPPGSPTDAS